MKKWMRMMALLLSLALCAGCATGLAEAGERAPGLGTKLGDFSVQTIDGDTFSLSGALEEKDMVLINLWASWCGPCGMEFPYLQQAYEKYQDRVAVIALSTEPDDSPEVLTSYARSRGMTFPVANDSATNLAMRFQVTAIPTSLVVDRFGRVALILVGAQPSEEAFDRIFEYFTSEEYTETTVLDGIPPALPTVSPAEPEALDDALNIEGGSLSFVNSEDRYTWPMVPATVDGRDVLVSSNAGQDGATARVTTLLTANEGDVLAFDFFTSTEAMYDLLTVRVDGETVKSFGGAHDWMRWAIRLPAGEHEVAFSYEKNGTVDSDEDTVMLDNVALLSGGEAAAALAALPAAPVSDAFDVRVSGDAAKRIAFDAPEGFLDQLVRCEDGWIVNADIVELEFALPAGIDPERAFLYSNFDDSIIPMSGALDEAGGVYRAATGVDSMASTGYSYTGVYFYPSDPVEDESLFHGTLLFADAENADAFVEQLSQYYPVSWAYAEDGVVDAAS